ncbi:MAG: calcium/sodium antiporter, partial [Planctomycetota bacterium]|jgi:cation:H+ antiporter
LTVVAFGTSSPEIAVSLKATYDGKGDIAFGNVVGSNIANILLVLGISASIGALVVAQKLVRWDVPIMIGAASVVGLLALDGSIGRVDGVLLLSALTAYLVFTIRASREETRAIKKEYADEFGPGEGDEETKKGSTWWNLLLVAIGFGMLVFGSDLLVKAAVSVAREFGVSELVIGLTIVAIGTSLPEVATSAVASLKGERDIAVGNVVGSNIFNMLAVLGVAGAFSPDGVPASQAAMDLDVPFMIATSIACLPVFFVGYNIARWEGFVFLGYYICYCTYLILIAKDSPLRQPFWDTMVLVGSITALTFGIILYRHWRALRNGTFERHQAT